MQIRYGIHTDCDFRLLCFVCLFALHFFVFGCVDCSAVGVANWEQLALRRNHDGDFEMVSFPTVSMLDNFAGTYVMFGLNDNFFYNDS